MRIIKGYISYSCSHRIRKQH